MEPGWRATWEDSEDDFVFCDGERQIGRAYLHNTGGIINGNWRWFFGALSGLANSRREALLAVEEAYERRATRADAALVRTGSSIRDEQC